MNSLNINLEEGQKVVMQGDCDEAKRTVIVKSGFGMSSFTRGTALFVETSNGEYIRVDGSEIEKIVELIPDN